MTSPFDSAWALLKAPTFQSQLNTPSLDGVQSYSGVPGIGERMWYKRKDAKNPIRLPEQPKHLRDGVNRGFLKPEVFHDYITEEMKAEQRHRKLLDAKDRFKQQLNQHIPRLEHQRGSYGVKVGPRDVGLVSTTTAERDDPQNNWTSLDEGKIADDAQRQGLYGRALRGIINDAGNLTSYARNRNSQPFHEQFNPINATKRINDIDGNQNFVANRFTPFRRNDSVTYTAKPPKETPRGFGDLQYDTGALPVYQTPIEPPKPYWQELAEIQQQQHGQKPAQQQTLDQYTYIPTPGGVTYGRR